jgi:exo-1,4-beta-D-glucosaminidase
MTAIDLDWKEEIPMKMTRLGLFAVLLAIAAPLAVADDAAMALKDNWRLQSAAQFSADGATVSMPGFDAKTWYPTSVPKTVLAALVDNKVYPDPYYATNMKDIPGYQDGLWLVMKEDSPFRAHWWYRTEFTVPEAGKDRVFTLHFDGINYEANIWLYGKLVAGADQVRGMFRRFEFPVTALLNPGKANALAVEIIPPGLRTDKLPRTKQVEATTGWDDHNPQPPDMNMGIWQNVYLREQGPVSLRNAYVEPKLSLPGLDSARLTLSVYARNNTDKPVTGTLTATIENIKLAQEVALQPGETREVFFKPEDCKELTIANPRVWWPHPLGSPELYDMNMAFKTGTQVSDTAQVRFGIRDITTYVKKDDWREYQVNGKPILIRGGAWMTSDMMLNLSKDRYAALIGYARNANLNMLRSEGFSIRETEDFYNLCDEMGVMVTQQIFGRSILDEDLAIACIDDMMLRVRTHPCLAHFLAHDETFPTDKLDAAYKGIIEKYRVDRTYQPHSGTFNIATRAKTGGTRTGTRELWTYASPAHYYYTDRKEDIAWGFAQSGGIGGIVAVRDSIRQMMPEDQLWPAMKTDAWSFHTVTQGAEYFDAVMKSMELQYGAPGNFDDFCTKAYAMNYSSARGMFEAYAKNKYEATGITTWKYDAAWPAAMTWQYVDWYLRGTAAYYGAKKACTPVHALYAYNDNTVYVTNSLRQPFAGLALRAAIYDMDSKKVWSKESAVDVGEDGVAKAFAVDVPAGISDPYFLRLDLADKDGNALSDNFYWLSRTPDIPGRDNELGEVYSTQPKSRADFTNLQHLKPARLEMNISSTPSSDDVKHLNVTVKNPGDTIAFLVQLAVRNTATDREAGPTFWSDNYFSLLPGETRDLTATVPNHALEGGLPRVSMTAWNLAE